VVLDVPVSNNSERGLLGLESVGNNVYLFFTESVIDGGDPLGNRIYKYSRSVIHPNPLPNSISPESSPVFKTKSDKSGLVNTKESRV